MKIVAAEVRGWRAALRRPIETSFGTLREREGLRVWLRDDVGRLGRGESAPLPGFGTEGLAEARRALDTALPGLAEVDPEAPVGGLAGSRALAAAPTARAALDAALHELVAQAAGLPVAAWLARRGGHRARGRVAVSRLLGSDTPEALAREAHHAVEQGFSTLKLKVGAAGASEDRARVAAVREGAGAAAELAVDANGAWSPAEALEGLEALSVHRLAWVEQPVAAADLDGLAFVRARSPVPVAADEALLLPGAARRVLDAGAADRLVLKPAALGGIGAANEIAAAARRAGVAVSVTSLLDGALGLHSALHFAASLPEPPFACGLATGDELVGDDLEAPRRTGATLVLAPGAGYGDLAPAGPRS